MTRFYFTVVLTSLFILLAPSTKLEAAETDENWYGCVGTTIEMGSCLSNRGKDFDARLLAVLDKNIEKYKEFEKMRLIENNYLLNLFKKEQESWSKMVEAMCARKRIEWGPGTGAGNESARCQLRMTLEREKFLKDNLKEISEYTF